MLTAIASALLASSTVSPQVDIGRFNPEAFPEAELRERRMPVHTMLSRVEEILRERRCQLEGQNYRRFDIRVPYVVMLQPDGTPTRFVVSDIGCAPLESFVGQVILELARAGDFAPTGAREPTWYTSELRFTVQ